MVRLVEGEPPGRPILGACLQFGGGAERKGAPDLVAVVSSARATSECAAPSLARANRRRPNRRVTRCRDGSSSCRSLNVHPQAQQRKRRLRQTKKVRLPAIGRSRTRTSGRSFTSQLARPQHGQQPLATPLNDSRHRQPLEPKQPTKVLVHPLFLPAPRS
jgi:hypothetical protein